MTQNDEYWNHQLPNPGQMPIQGKPVAQEQPTAQPARQEASSSDDASAPQVQEPLQVEQQPAQPVQPAVPAEQPVQAAATVEQPVQAAVTVEQPVQPAVPVEQPVQPTVSAAQPARPAQFAAAQAAQPQASFGAAGPSQPAPAYAAAPQFQPAPVQQSKGGRGWIVAIVFIVLLFAFMAFCFKSCSDSMSSLTDLGTARGSSLTNLSKDAVAILELDGTIQYDDSACSPEGLKKLLDQAQKNDYVKALVIRVNSGGGTATAGEEMAEYLRQFEKPVVVSSASINASAAYEISSQADYIFVAKSTEIGAIGTVMQVTDLSGLFEKLGIRMETIASADSKDSSYGYRPLTDDEREYYQHMIDQINEMFIENVAEGRHMDIEKVRKHATGLVFTGVDAVENGLADSVGTREDAIKKAAELAGITDYTTVDLSLSSYDLSELAYLLGEDRSEAEELLDLLRHSDSVQVTH